MVGPRSFRGQHPPTDAIRRPFTSKDVTSSGRAEMAMSRSSARMRFTQSSVPGASLAGLTVKTWSYLFL
jgi:hypothetical protein